MTAGKRVSIRDVAALAGVSLGTASRAVNRSGAVSPRLQAQVDAAIEQLHYRPNHAAKTLRSGSSATVGCLLSDVGNPLYGRLFRALEHRLHDHGYLLLLANALNDPEREVRALTSFDTRGMDGMIIAPGNETHPDVLRAVDSAQAPVVVLDRDLDVARDRVDFGHAAAMAEVVGSLAALGHRRIALVLWEAGSRPVRRRQDGFLAATADAGLDCADLVLKAATPSSPVFDEVGDLLAAPDPPTAFIAQGTNILMTTVQAIAEAGLSVPGDVSIVSIGDNEFARAHRPPIACLRMDEDLLVGQVCDLLVARMTGGYDGAPVTRTVDYAFDPAGTCGPPGGR